MRLKSVLLATAAAVLLVSSTQAQAEGFYFSVLGGANFLDAEDGTFTDFFRGKSTVRAHFDPDTGFLFGTAGGLSLDHWLHGQANQPLKGITQIRESPIRVKTSGRWYNSSPRLPGTIGAGALRRLDQAQALVPARLGVFWRPTRVQPVFGAAIRPPKPMGRLGAP